jgi:pimeloyl-ACP methyl ester carboxylesterase
MPAELQDAQRVCVQQINVNRSRRVSALAVMTSICFGHSLGGTLALAAELRRPGTFAAMFVYEPVISDGRAPPASAPCQPSNPAHDGAHQSLTGCTCLQSICTGQWP